MTTLVSPGHADEETVVEADLEVIWEVQRLAECQTSPAVEPLFPLVEVARQLGDLVQVEGVRSPIFAMSALDSTIAI